MTELELLTKLLFDKYQKIVLTAEEAATVLNCDTDSLKNDRSEAIGIPYTRRNNKERGKILYSITAIAKTMIENQKKTV